jgi:hypothetical protein
MIQHTVSPPKETSKNHSTNQQTFKPPMNTDAHRLKADKETLVLLKNEFVFFMSLSVFIGVHRWLKIVFNILSQDVSADDFLGVRDASVCG